MQQSKIILANRSSNAWGIDCSPIAYMEKSFSELRWMPLAGRFDVDGDELVYTGGEYEPTAQNIVTEAKVPGDSGAAEPARQKFVYFGTLIFNQNFSEGRIKCQVEFDEVDHRSNASMIIQYDSGNRGNAHIWY